MSEPKILEIYVIMTCDRQAGDQIRGDFFVTLDAAKAEIDRLYDREATDSPKFIERLEPGIHYAGFQSINRWGYWRTYSIRRIDRHDRTSDDLKAEVAEGRKAKLGI